MNEFKQMGDRIISTYRHELAKKPSKAMSFVVNKLKPEHVEAALWLHDNFKMKMSSDNLGNLIMNFDMGKLIANSTEKLTVASGFIAKGDFHPNELAAFFKFKASSRDHDHAPGHS